jgi:hypothetical protein
MTLEQALREAAKRGLSGLTLWPTSDGRWQANAKRGNGWLVEHAADPVDALRLALSPLSEPKADTTPPEQDIFG